MEVTVPQVSLARARVSRLSVGHLSVGPVTVGRLDVRGVRVGVRADRARLDAVTTTLTVVAFLWWDPPFRGPRRSRLGDADLSFEVGDVDVPEIRNIDITIPTLAAPGVAVGVAPIAGVQLTQLVAEDVVARGARLPTPPFQLTGLGLGTVEVEGVSVPGTSVDSAVVGHVRAIP